MLHSRMFFLLLILAIGPNHSFASPKETKISDQEFNRFSNQFIKPDWGTPDHLINEIKSLTITSDKIESATQLTTQLMLLNQAKIPHSHKRKHWPEQWKKLSANAKKPLKNSVMAWEKRAHQSQILEYVLNLYGTDASITSTINLFLNWNGSLPYFDLILINASKELTGQSIRNIFYPNPLPEESKKIIFQLLKGDKLAHWAKTRPTDLKQYAGQTNTILGIYDWITYPEFASIIGSDLFPKKADVYYDLGGGFATPDISRTLGHNFISADILAPKEAQKFNLHFEKMISWNTHNQMGIFETSNLSDKEVAAYISKLNETPFLNFDVFKDSFPTKYESYFITSFGFLSSEASKSVQNGKVIPGYDTSYAGVRRVFELVAIGKSVDLFTYSRAKGRLLKTVFLSFRNHRLQAVRVWPDGSEKFNKLPEVFPARMTK